MEQIFTSDERAADLIGWTEKLDGLGNIIEAFGYGNASLEYHCKILGPIISDYAHAIKATLSAVYPELDELFEGFETISLGKINLKYKKILDISAHPDRTNMIKENLEEIQDVKKKISEMLDIEKDLKMMLKRSA